MKVRHLIPVATVLIVVAVFAQALGQEPGRLRRVHEWCGIPDLTEEQQAQIDELKTALEKEMLPMRTKLEVKQAELQELLVADNPNKGAIDRKIDEISSLRTQMQKKRIDNRLKTRVLLTPEQRVKFDQRFPGGYRDFWHCGFHCMGKRPMRVREMRMEKRMLRDVEEDVEIEEVKE